MSYMNNDNESRPKKIRRLLLEQALRGTIDDETLIQALPVIESEKPEDQNKVKLLGQLLDKEIETGAFNRRWFMEATGRNSDEIEPMSEEWKKQVSLKLVQNIDSIPFEILRAASDVINLSVRKADGISNRADILEQFRKDQLDNDMLKTLEKLMEEDKVIPSNSRSDSPVKPLTIFQNMEFVFIKPDTLKGFYLQTTPVTVGQWRVFSQSGYKTKAEKDGWAYVWRQGMLLNDWEKILNINWDAPGFQQTESHPVTCICRDDAKAFIQWLNNQSKNKFRLPTEAEWEYACRAGSFSAYCYGDDPADLKQYAWHSKNSRSTRPVRQLKPNAWGIYDMHGNVWELCESNMKGGSWLYDADKCRVTQSGKGKPENTNETGFRLLMELD